VLTFAIKTPELTMRSEQEPVVTQYRDQQIFTHPAFGNISLHVHRGRQRLFGSEFVHDSAVVIEIKSGEQIRSCSDDRFSGTEPIVEVKLTESQWARFVSSGGVGEGVPCTIRCQRTGPIVVHPEIANAEETRQDLHAREIRESAAKAIEECTKALDKIEAMCDDKLTKTGVREVVKSFRHALRNLPANHEHSFNMFCEATENVVEQAKIETEAYLDRIANQIGWNTILDQVAKLEKQPPTNVGHYESLPELEIQNADD
jgi:hypothetical protein